MLLALSIEIGSRGSTTFIPPNTRAKKTRKEKMRDRRLGIRMPRLAGTPDAEGKMRSPEADPQKVLRHVLARAGLVVGYDHVCRRCKANGKPHVERHRDAGTTPLPGLRDEAVA
jgi:hypothetical protein